MILTSIYWKISFEKHIPKHLISLLYNFFFIFRRHYLIIKKLILKTYPPKFMILNVDFALKLSNYTSWKRFICLKWILKRFSTILHTQFNHHTLPVTPFKGTSVLISSDPLFYLTSKLVKQRYYTISNLFGTFFRTNPYKYL